MVCYYLFVHSFLQAPAAFGFTTFLIHEVQLYPSDLGFSKKDSKLSNCLNFAALDKESEYEAT